MSNKLLRGETILPLETNQAARNYRDSLAMEHFGMKASEAISQGVCVSCRQKALAFTTGVARTEYSITALCEPCQDRFYNLLN